MAKRDTQRSKVYSLHPPGKGSGRELTLAECDDLVARAHQRYGLVWTGKVTDGRGQRRALSYGTYRIALPRWARTEETVLHEAAHAIISKKWAFGDDQAPHGPEYVRVMLELWAWAKLGTMPELRAQAREKRVKVSQAAAYIPPKVTATLAVERARAKVAALETQLRAAKRELNEARANLK